MKIYVLVLLMSAILAASHVLEQRKLAQAEGPGTSDAPDRVAA